MGTLIYGTPGVGIVLADRTLAHLRVVVLAKPRRDEKFALSWDDTDTGTSRTLWLQPAIPLQFEIATEPAVVLNREWINALTASSHSGGGLRIIPEPQTQPTSGTATKA